MNAWQCPPNIGGHIHVKREDNWSIEGTDYQPLPDDEVYICIIFHGFGRLVKVT